MEQDVLNKEQKSVRIKIIFFIGVAMALYHFYSAMVGTLIPNQQRGIHLTFALVLVALLYPVKFKSAARTNIVTAAHILVVVVCGLYLVYQNRAANQLILVRQGPSGLDLLMGTLLLIIILDSVRRATGWALPILSSIFLAYCLWGGGLPGLLGHRGYSWRTMVDQLLFSTEGVYGQPLGVSATYVAMFIMFGSFLSVSGGGQWFVDMAFALTGRTRSGPAMTAVVSSALLGTISGTGVANVVTTGSFTIPLMISTGYRPVFAGAVEAVASTGGQIMPPVMGAGAFILAEILGIGYGDVAIAAAIPAFLYFLACGIQVHFEACKLGLKGLPKEQLPDAKKTLLRGLPYIIPLAVLIWALVIRRFSPSYSGLYAIAAIVTASILLKRKGERMGLRQIMNAMAEAAEGMVPVAMACACAGVIIGALLRTGLTLRFTSLILNVAGDSVIMVLVLTMISCVVLGMGLPTTAAFIVTSTLCAPALIKLGITSMGAYLFVFYFACISSITPPVAMAAYAAAGISKASTMQTGVYATKLGIAGFLVPYFFCFNEGLLLQGNILAIIQQTITAMIGIVLLGIGLEGFFKCKMRWYERTLLVIASLLLIDKGLITDLIGVLCALMGFASEHMRYVKDSTVKS